MNFVEVKSESGNLTVENINNEVVVNLYNLLNIESYATFLDRGFSKMEYISNSIESQDNIKRLYNNPVIEDEFYFVSSKDMDNILNDLNTTILEICVGMKINYLNARNYPYFSDNVFAVYYNLPSEDENLTITRNGKVFGRGYFLNPATIVYIMEYWRIHNYSHNNICQTKDGIYINNELHEFVIRDVCYNSEDGNYFLLASDYNNGGEEISYSGDSIMELSFKLGRDYSFFKDCSLSDLNGFLFGYLLFYE